MQWRPSILAFIFSLCPLAIHGKGIPYQVEYEGLEDSKVLKALQSASQLTTLKKRPPASINALRFRAESDIPEMLKVLHSHGYYEGKIDISIQEVLGRMQVIVLINPGPRYRLTSYEIKLDCPEKELTCCHLDLESIGIKLGKPAITQNVLNAELQILRRLSECGFPLAEIKERKYVLDAQTKEMRVSVEVATGAKARFGPSEIVGLKSVKPEFIEKSFGWQTGESYDSRLVDETQNTLIGTQLFNSVLISHENTIDSSGELPMRIELSETRHRSINAGVSYQTVFGPGITFGWENRNVAGMGRHFSFQGDVTRISQTGLASYTHPDFMRINQDLILQGQAMHEALFAYSMRSYSLLERLDRRFGLRMRAAMGMREERLYVTASEQNGNYWLLEFPIYFRWSSANDLLNPTRGATLEFTTTPTLNVTDWKDAYLVQEITESTYHPLTRNARIVFAQKITLGILWSDGLHPVPLSKRFLGGSEEELRGYRYRTVSPLEHHKPIGGRSAIYITLETRFRVSKTIGLVPFFDMGAIYRTQYPTIHGKWFKSVGLGFRYFSFIGPFRVDLAFPLDRRKGIDPVYKFLVSIGQSF